jgi:signal transduction histidine kinase
VLVVCRQRGSAVHIEVRDSGIGISAHELTCIFKPFYGVNATRAGGGLGIGLFIVERAAHFLGHCMKVRSAMGRGSCFTVIAKAAPSSVAAAAV